MTPAEQLERAIRNAVVEEVCAIAVNETRRALRDNEDQIAMKVAKIVAQAMTELIAAFKPPAKE
jgi:hypothetical protein